MGNCATVAAAQCEFGGGKRSMLPDSFSNEDHLDEFMSTPSEELVRLMGRLDGDILILGIAGKMGHTLGRQALRAIQIAKVEKRVIGVSRFTNPQSRKKIESYGISTVSCDLLDPGAVADLPDAENVVFMAGRKFGTEGNEHLTWAMNCDLPAICSRRYRHSRIVVFSTGCVYPPASPADGGCTEAQKPKPVGEYAMSCLGRERIFEHYSALFGTKIAIARLNYAVDMRYGVLRDIADRIAGGIAVDLTVPAFNVIWQGDATDHILRLLEHCSTPPFVINITGSEQISTRTIATELSDLMDVPVTLPDTEGDIALLSDSTKSASLLGPPRIAMETMVRWTAKWVSAGGPSLEKPTHFEVMDGKF